MRLVEQHIIKYSNKYYKDIIKLCKLSKNLYNTTLYEIRQHFFLNGSYLQYVDLDRKFKETNNIDYRVLPIQTSQQVMRMVDSNFKSFFRHLKSKKLNEKVNIPHYLDKNGSFVVTFTNQQISSKYLKDGIIKIPFTEIKIPTTKSNIKQVRFIPKCSYVVMEVVYDVKECDLKTNNKRYSSIDIGINNLATVTSNVIKPYIINGKPIKSINQYYNKETSNCRSNNNKKRQRRLSLKRENKIKDYFHKSSSYIVNQLVSDSINTLIIGRNKDWKQDTNMGTMNNQKFVFIPHSKFISMLQYKCRLKGINVLLREESYTSKSSFLDSDPLTKTESFSGKRIKRGLYRTKNGTLINSDVNGSLNILRKEVWDVLLPPDRGFVLNPYKLTF